MTKNIIRSTTVLCVRKNDKVVMAADGQVSQGSIIMKAHAHKIRALSDGKILAGFAGATADALTLYERLETKLEQYPSQLSRACVELAKEWRMDKALRRLEALMAVADHQVSLIVSGTGDVIEPDDGILAIGSGGPFALAAARALLTQNLSADEIVEKSLTIAADICVYTNHNIQRISL